MLLESSKECSRSWRDGSLVKIVVLLTVRSGDLSLTPGIHR